MEKIQFHLSWFSRNELLHWRIINVLFQYQVDISDSCGLWVVLTIPLHPLQMGCWKDIFLCSYQVEHPKKQTNTNAGKSECALGGLQRSNTRGHCGQQVMLLLPLIQFLWNIIVLNNKTNCKNFDFGLVRSSLEGSWLKKWMAPSHFPGQSISHHTARYIPSCDLELGHDSIAWENLILPHLPLCRATLGF